MTGPKHLWSGDWEDEPAAAPGAAAGPAEGPAPAAAPSAPGPNHPANDRRRRLAAIVTLAVLVIAGIAVAATTLGGSSRKRSATATTAAAAPPAQQPTFPQQTPTPTNPTTPTTPTTPVTPTTATGTTPAASAVAPQPVNWLGMEVITVPNGSAVVDTVMAGGAGDTAGVEPGDVINEIDQHPVAGSKGITRAIDGKHRGDTIKLELVRGGSILDLRATLGAPPSAYP